MVTVPQTPTEYRAWWEANTDVPYGLCWCRCGQETGRARQRDTRLNYFRGEPVRYVRGHAYTKPIGKADYAVKECGHETPCWIWQRGIGNEGYGTTYERGTGRPLLAHRVYFEHHKGAIPEGLELDHLCRNRPCVNPAHLEPVTGATNVQRGRHAKLTADRVLEIRRLSATGAHTHASLGKLFGVTRGNIGAICRGKSWRNV